MSAFAPLSLAADSQPASLNEGRVVQLERAHTLQSFLQHYPSAATPEVVGLINGLESGGSLPAGTLAKRVVAGS